MDGSAINPSLVPAPTPDSSRASHTLFQPPKATVLISIYPFTDAHIYTHNLKFL